MKIYLQILVLRVCGFESMTIQMKAIGHYFPALGFIMLYKVGFDF